MPRLPARSIVLLLLVATASVIVPRADAQQRFGIVQPAPLQRFP